MLRPMNDNALLRDQPDGAVLRVKVLPRAPRSEIVGALGGELKIRIAAPPVESAANAALVEFLAARLGCSRREVTLLRGHKSPHKVVKLHGLSAADAASRLSVAD